MLDQIIETCYTGGTRGIRVLNFLLATIWAIAMIADSAGLVIIATPGGVLHGNIAMLIVAISIAGMSAASFGFKNDAKSRMLMKYFSLHLGSLFQILIAIQYALVYPPLDLSIILAFLLSAWFLGAAYYNKHEYDKIVCKELGAV